MRNLFFLPRIVSHERLLFGVIVLAVTMLLPTAPAAAQDTPAEQGRGIERDKKLRVGVYLSRTGLQSGVYTFFAAVPFYGDPDIENIEDIAPYPFRFFSIRYNKYQAIWSSVSDRNEHVKRFYVRYNYYPLKKVVYIFGGPIILHFNRKFSHNVTNYVYTGDITGDLPGEERCDGETIPVSVEIKTDRPDGKSIIPGINAGFGVEYTLLFDTIVISHEIEFYQLACKFKGLTCKGSDFKFLGLHLKI